MQVLLCDGISLDDDVLAQVATLEHRLFDDSWDKSAILSALSQFGAGLTIAQHDDKVVGFLVYQIVFEVAEILRIATDPEYQNTGIGTALLNEFIKLSTNKHAERLLLEVRADNDNAIGFYHKHGFYQIDVRKGYYQDGRVDALILQKDLQKDL